jgi:hypothetical protein
LILQKLSNQSACCILLACILHQNASRNDSTSDPF